MATPPPLDYQGYVSSQDPRTLPAVQPTGAIRNLQLEGGSPGAYADLSNRTAGTVASSTPSTQFGNLLMGLLQRYQQLGTGKFAQQGFNAQDAQTQAGTSAALDPSLRGYSPGVIQGAHENAQAPYEPIIRGAQQGAQTYGEQVKSFGNALTTTRNLIKDYEASQNSQRDDARTVIQNALTIAGGGAFDGADPNEVSQLEKIAGYPKNFLTHLTKTIKERELELKRQSHSGSGSEQIDYSPDVQPTASGLKFLDTSQYLGKDKTSAQAWARRNGIPLVSKDQAETLQNIDNARFNQNSIMKQVRQYLPKDASGRLIVGPSNKLKKYLQTNEQIGAFNSWRTAAINSLKATAGSKGLRINQAEIAAAVENDIPQITDTVGVAQQKYQNIMTLLDNAEKSILQRSITQ